MIKDIFLSSYEKLEGVIIQKLNEINSGQVERERIKNELKTIKENDDAKSFCSYTN